MLDLEVKVPMSQGPREVFFCLLPEVREYRIDDRRVFYTSDDLDRSVSSDHAGHSCFGR